MGDPNGGTPRHGEHAIVLGASISGLATAAALQPYFGRVTIVERDALPTEPANRRGVPQGHHNHALFTGGRDALDTLLPGFSERMAQAGVPLLDQPRDIAFLTGQGWLARAETGVVTFFARRPTLEFVIRELVAELPRVTIVQGTARGPLASADRSRVTGVVVESPDGAEEELLADLVVDATGRASRATKWLESLGYDVPPEVEVHPHLGYSSRLIRVPDDAWPDGVRGVVALPYPGVSRGGAITEQDNGYSILTAAGAAGDFPPGDEEGLEEFLKSAITPVLWEIYAKSEPASEIVTTRTSVNIMRSFHLMDRRPAGFVCVGDSMMCMNPAYGQGMTNGTRQALAFHHRLGEPGADLDAVVDGFPAHVVEINAFAWGVAVGSDMRRATTEAVGMAPPTPEELAGAEYFGRLERAATADGRLVGLLQGAINQMDPSPLFADDVRERIEELAGAERPDWVTDVSRVPRLIAS